MVSLNKPDLNKPEEITKMYEVTPVHLTEEVSPVTQIVPTHKNELERYLESSDVAVAQKKAPPAVVAAPEMGVMACINQKEKAQEKVDAFLKQSEVFALRRDFRFKYDKKTVLIEQGTRIRIDNARKISDDGKTVIVDLSSVTKDDWDSGCYERKFRYRGLRINIDALEKYFEPDVEVTRLLNRRDVFKYLCVTSIGFSVILGLFIFSWCIFRHTTEYAFMFKSLVIGCGVLGVLSVLCGALWMCTCKTIYERLSDVENQSLQQRTLMQHKDEG